MPRASDSEYFGIYFIKIHILLTEIKAWVLFFSILPKTPLCGFEIYEMETNADQTEPWLNSLIIYIFIGTSQNGIEI